MSWTDADGAALGAKWLEVEKYREFALKHPSGLADPDRDGLDAEHRDKTMNRHLVEQIGQIVNMEHEYITAPKMGPAAKVVLARMERVREEARQIYKRLDEIKDEVESAEYDYSKAKGPAKRKFTAIIKALNKEGDLLSQREQELRAYQKNIVDWDLGLAVAKDAGIPAFDDRWSRHQKHDFQFTTRASGWTPSGYEVRDEQNRVVARARTREGAHRASRRRGLAGTVERRA